MAIREELVLDLSQALSQIDDLERQLDGLIQPIVIPVEVESTQALDDLNRQIRQADADDIDIDVDTTEVDQADAAFQELRRELGLVDDELEDVEDQTKRTGRQMEDAGKRGRSAFGAIATGVGLATAAFAAFRGAGALLDFFGDSIQAASNLEESLSKTRVVFGDFASNIEDFASTAPQALGLANAAALEFTGTFGNLFVALGLSQSAAADLAPEIVQLGADLASFNNIEVTEALDKLRAGLVGEAEPLRALGVNITAATTAAKALELGLADSNGEVSEAAKVQARYALILEQTATAQGDFARTSDGIANRQRTLAAEFENLRQSIGEALLPVFEQLLDAAPALIEAVENLTPAISAMGSAFGDALEDSDGFLVFLVDLGRTLPGAIADLTSIGQALVNFSPLQIFGGVDNSVEKIGDGLQNVNDIIDRISVDQLKTGLVDQLRAGEDAAQALEGQLLGLRGVSLPAEELGEVAASLAQISGAGAGDIARISLAFGELGEEAGFTADEVDEIRAALAAINEIEVNRLSFDRGGGRTARAEAESAALAAITESEALEQLGAVADATGVSLAELLGVTGELPPEFEALAGQVSGGTLRFLESVERIDELKNEIETLPGSMQAAQAALKNEEDEIVSDFSDFFDNLLEELEAREAFESNLAILRALGLDALAETFDQAGLEAAGALADAVANPAEAQAAESALDGQYAGVAESVVATMEETIRGLPVTQGLIDNLIDAAGAADTPDVRSALLALADSLKFDIDVGFNVGKFPGISNAGRLPEFTGAPGQNATVINNNNNNFYTEPNPTTDTARISQAVSGVIGGNQAQ